MNEWVHRSIEKATSPGYLDELARIYPTIPQPRRALDEKSKEEIAFFHKTGDWQKLLEILFQLWKEGFPSFPFEHPFASLLVQRAELRLSNPKIFHLLGEILLSMSVEDIVKGIERPPDLNRTMGSSFRKWLRDYFPSKGFPIHSEPGFEQAEIAILKAANTKIRKYAERKLSLKLEKGRDFLIKVCDKYIIGEARFLSTSGGSQTRDLKEAIKFIKSIRTPKIIVVAVLDGIVWFDESYLEMVKALANDEYALTALLLHEFLDSLR